MNPVRDHLSEDKSYVTCFEGLVLLAIAELFVPVLADADGRFGRLVVSVRLCEQEAVPAGSDTVETRPGPPPRHFS